MGVQSVLGGETAWFCEFDKAPSAILAHHWPHVPNLGDITKVDWTQVEPVDVLTGGSPCQDLSHAGKRAGMSEGTRSNLWVQMREAIAALRPRLIVWENVRGALSAEATSDLEPCAGCVGDPGDGRVVLRALGRVLGDLADLGYDARWYGLRAADVGAAHGRFRVFLFATPADADDTGWGEQRRAESVRAQQSPAEHVGADAGLGDVAQLAGDPVNSDGVDVDGDGGRVTEDLFEPNVDGFEEVGGGGRGVGANGDRVHGGNASDLDPHVKEPTLLPTPAVNDMGASYTPETWDAWTAKMQAAHGNGNGHGKSLAIEAQRLLPTPNTLNHKESGLCRDFGGDMTHALICGCQGERSDSTQDHTREELRDLRDAALSKAVREAPRGLHGIHETEALQPVVRQQQEAGDEGRAPLARPEASEGLLRELPLDDGPSRSPRGQEPDEQRSVESDDAVRELPPETALARGPREAAGGDQPGSVQSWGEYQAAIRRWEMALGRPAPSPTIPRESDGKAQLSAAFCEWLMGLPAGHVTDTGITRNEQLKALGNGVVPQQAAAATRAWLADTYQEARTA